MKKFTFTLLTVCGLLAAAYSANAQSFVGLGYDGNTVSTYSAPGAMPTTYAVTGLNNSDRLINIDYFSSGTGQLFGMGSSGTLYTLAQSGTTTYAATVNVNYAVPGATVIDFNPMANRLRVYAGTSNYRLTPTVGLVTNDGTLAFVSGDPNFGTSPNLTAAAYLNNFPGTTATSLYSIDASLDALILNINGPGFSGLTTVGTLTLGGVRLDVGAGTTGFDIYTLNGVNTAYLSSGNSLYTVNLSNGALTSLGRQLGTNIIDVAVVPEPGTWAMWSVGVVALGFVAYRRRRLAA